ncbi:MAG TPA: TlpA disulfide reductase family protein [Flavisolibacter sp.]|nr:TlpA disulfide reductase family protein [Flavisolibacter sp.]
MLLKIFLLSILISLFSLNTKSQHPIKFTGNIPDYKGNIYFEFVGSQRPHFKDSVRTRNGNFIYSLKKSIFKIEPYWVNVYYKDSNGNLKQMNFFRSMKKGKLSAFSQLSFSRENIEIRPHKKYKQLFESTQTKDIQLDNIMADSYLIETLNPNKIDSSKRQIQLYNLKKNVRRNNKSWYLLRRVYDERSKFFPSELVTVLNFFSRSLFEDYPQHYFKLQQYISIRRSIDKHGKFQNALLMDSVGKANYIVGKDAKLTLVVFWASWCIPCREEIPLLKTAFKLYEKTGFSITSISIDESRHSWIQALRKENMFWKNLVLDDKSMKEHYGITSIPLSFLVDRNGDMYEIDIRDEERFRKNVQMLLQQTK